MPEPVTALSPCVWAIAVAYQPQEEQLLRLVERVRHDVDRVVVVDNSPETTGWQSVLPDGVDVINPGRNIGIAGAHNLGIQRALSQGASHILLLDQDSLPRQNMLTHLLAAEKTLLDQGSPFAAVGPVTVDARDGRTEPFIQFKGPFLGKFQCPTPQDPGPVVRVAFLISSGTLIRREVLEQCGDMATEFFIDCVDFEWAFRCAAQGLASYGVCSAWMEHNLGDSVHELPVLGKRVHFHSPVRRYYQFRNAILLYRKPHTPWRWIINDVPRLLFRLAVYLTMQKDRLAQAKLILRGLVDGIRGRSGPLRDK